MEEKIKLIIDKLITNNKTISMMESCTGGGLSNEITNVERASEVLKFSAVTYSNEYKIKMGVSPDVIDKYSVYSGECADEMSFNISKFSNSDLGVGVTGKLNRSDPNNPRGDDNTVFISVYDRRNDCFNKKSIVVDGSSREINKKVVLDTILEMLFNIIK